MEQQPNSVAWEPEDRSDHQAALRMMCGVEYQDHNTTRIPYSTEYRRLCEMTEQLDRAARSTLLMEKQLYIQIRLAWCRVEAMRRTMLAEIQAQQTTLDFDH